MWASEMSIKKQSVKSFARRFQPCRITLETFKKTIRFILLADYLMNPCDNPTSSTSNNLFQSIEVQYYEDTDSLEADREKLKLGVVFHSIRPEVSMRHSQKSIEKPLNTKLGIKNFPAKLQTAN